jgi:hypothetical protein
MLLRLPRRFARITSSSFRLFPSDHRKEFLASYPAQGMARKSGAVRYAVQQHAPLVSPFVDEVIDRHSNWDPAERPRDVDEGGRWI